MASMIRFIPLAAVAMSLGIPHLAVAGYSHTAFVGSVPIGSSQVPLAGVTVYDYSASPGPQRQDLASVAISSDPIASIGLSAQTTNPLGQTFFSASANLSYSFEVFAQPLTLVPVDYLGLYSAVQIGQNSISQTSLGLGIQSSNAGPYSIVDFRLTVPAACGTAPICSIIDTYHTDGNSVGYAFNQVNSNTVNGSFFGVLNLLTDANGRAGAVIQLSAGVQLNAFPGTAEGSAYIDPMLSISHAFLAANPDTVLTITPGVGNAISAVPELGSSALLMLGMLVLAGTRVLRRWPTSG